MTKLCLDLVSSGIDFDVQIEAMKLCVGVLIREGGSLPVQEAINEYLESIPSHFMFLQLRKVSFAYLGFIGSSVNFHSIIVCVPACVCVSFLLSLSSLLL